MKPVYAVLGSRCTFTVEAARCYWGDGVDLLGLKSIPEVFESVVQSGVSGGMVPVENSIAGRIPETEAGLREFTVVVAGEICLTIQHCLLSTKPLAIDRVNLVFSQAQVFAQCRRFLREHLPWVTLVAVANTELAIQMARHAGENSAAVGSALAADIYGMHVVAKGIQDSDSNVTRFLHIKPREPQ